MVQRGEDLRFALQAGQPLTIAAAVAGRPAEDLEGDVPPERGVVGAVDLAHAAAAEEADHTQVRADRIAGAQAFRRQRQAAVEQPVRRGVGLQHPFDDGDEGLVSAGGVAHAPAAVGRRPFQGRLEQLARTLERAGVVVVAVRLSKVAHLGDARARSV